MSLVQAQYRPPFFYNLNPPHIIQNELNTKAPATPRAMSVVQVSYLKNRRISFISY